MLSAPISSLPFLSILIAALISFLKYTFYILHTRQCKSSLSFITPACCTWLPTMSSWYKYIYILLFHLIQNSHLRVQRCSQAKHQRRVGLWQSYSAQLFVISQNKMWLRVIYCNSSSSGQTSRFNPKWSHKYDVLKPTVEQIKRWMWTHDVLTSSTPLPC